MLGFIGVGNMARAILSGVLREKVREEDVLLFDANAAQYAAFPKAQIASSELEVAKRADLIFFAVKPQVLPTVLEKLQGTDVTGKLFVSICAAVATTYLTKALPGAHVVRAMPNTPMLYGRGVCALSRGAGVSDAEFSSVRDLFEVLGTTIVLPEERQNAVIAVTGSSPAYLFELADAMARAGEESGFSYEECVKLVADVFEGAAAMLRESDMSPSELCDMVCSPGGTTLEAMRVFREAGFSETVKAAMQACTDRAAELEKA